MKQSTYWLLMTMMLGINCVVCSMKTDPKVQACLKECDEKWSKEKNLEGSMNCFGRGNCATVATPYADLHWEKCKKACDP